MLAGSGTLTVHVTQGVGWAVAITGRKPSIPATKVRRRRNMRILPRFRLRPELHARGRSAQMQFSSRPSATELLVNALAIEQRTAQGKTLFSQSAAGRPSRTFPTASLSTASLTLAHTDTAQSTIAGDSGNKKPTTMGWAHLTEGFESQGAALSSTFIRTIFRFGFAFACCSCKAPSFSAADCIPSNLSKGLLLLHRFKG
jgi:hypothetical protein